MDEETARVRRSREVEQGLRQFLGTDGPKGNTPAFQVAWVKNFEWTQDDRDYYAKRRTYWLEEQGLCVEEAEEQAYACVQNRRMEAKQASPVDVYKFTVKK